MSNEITTIDQSPVSTMLDVVARAASDPNCDPQKMHALLDVQERMMNKQAEIDFNQAMVALQSELPVIKKTGAIVHKTTKIADYAKFEDIMRVLSPLLVKEGFAITFGTESIEGRTIITGRLAHRSGHSITERIPLSLDTGGAKSNVQAMGSTISYGKRYLLAMLFNLVFEGEDDDGMSGGVSYLDEYQIGTIIDLIERTGSDKDKFLKWAGAASIEDIQASKYENALSLLRAKLPRDGGNND